MSISYFDAHSHLNFPDYGADLPDILSRMKEENIWTITVGTDLESSRRAVELAEKEGGIFASVGIHPVDDREARFVEEEFEKLAAHPKTVAIGECGLDYYRVDTGDGSEKSRQKKLFTQQIEFALKHGKPLMIHARDAYDELIEILTAYKRQNPNLKGNTHFFSGNLLQAKKLVDLEFTLSFAGPITFSSDYNEVIRSVPLSSILSETDSPFVAPVPHRAKRNEPSYVKEIVKTIIFLRSEEEEKVKEVLVQNVLRLFKIHD
jgi:TatD DNase family protein